MKVNGDWSKFDSRDAQILALATKINELTFSNATALVTNSNNSSDDFKTDDSVVLAKGQVPGTEVAKYRTEFKGDCIKINGKKNWFCRNYKLKGKWDGLYCWHHLKNKDGSVDSGGQPAGGIEWLLSQAEAQGN